MPPVLQEQLDTFTTADYPFHKDFEGADLIIQSADRVEFFVLKALLSVGSRSSFFGHLLADSRPSETRNGIPTLALPESSTVIRSVLSFCYPLDAPVLETVPEIVTVGEAMTKYCLDMAINRLQKSVITSRIITTEPLRVFAIAVHNGWKELGEAAARHTLSVPLDQLSPIPELALISALDLAHLIEYHRECGRSMQSIVERREYTLGLAMHWMSGRPGVEKLLFRQTAWRKWCKGRLSYRIILGDGHGQGDVHNWAVLFIEQAMTQLKLRPCPQTVFDEVLLGSTIIQSLNDCNSEGWKAIAYSQIHAFSRVLAAEVERLVSQVTLKITWACDKTET